MIFCKWLIKSKWVIFKCLLKYLKVAKPYLISQGNKGENSLPTKNLVLSDFPKMSNKL